MNCNDIAYEILERLAYPERYVDTSEWFSGDGPFEAYCDKLAEEARLLLDGWK